MGSLAELGGSPCHAFALFAHVIVGGNHKGAGAWGGGYIGSVVTGRLVKSGHEVVVLDNLQTGHGETVHPGSLFVRSDLRSTTVVDLLLANHHFYAVMHFDSNTLVGESMEQPFLRG